mmetsp:Transcript_27743/g.50405  ORF Transcript_27743/g.50405 Transcript_27743/m.50405 type:complete len:294 (+) Transcript_27743:179-1060(+)
MILAPHDTVKMSLFLFGGKGSKELGLFFECLETSVSKLGGGIDELEVDRFQVLAARMVLETLAKNEGTLLDTDNGTLEHDPILVNLSVTDKSSHGSNGLFRQVGLRLARGSIALLANAVDLLVEFGTVKVTVLTSTRDRGGHTGRMPRSNTGHLTKTSVGLTGKTSDAPTGSDTLVTVTLGDSHDVHLLILGKDGIDSDFLLKQALGKVDLGLAVGSSIDLNLHNVRLLDAKVELLDLGVGNHAHHRAEFANALELVLNVLTTVRRILLSITSVGLLLGSKPVLVAATLEFLG